MELRIKDAWIRLRIVKNKGFKILAFGKSHIWINLWKVEIHFDNMPF